MEFTFRIGRGDGTWGAARVYHLDGWRLNASDAYRLTWRPGPKILVRRLAVTAVAGLLIACVYLGLLPPRENPNSAIPERARRQVDEVERLGLQMTESPNRPETWGPAVVQEQERLDRRHIMVRAAWMTVTGLLAFIGLQAAFGAIWFRVSLQIDQRGMLRVQRRNWFTRTIECRRDAFAMVTCGAEEQRVYLDGLRIRSRWRWYVRLIPNTDDRAFAELDSPPLFVDFRLLRQSDLPIRRSPIPEDVRVLVEWLRWATEAPASEPVFTGAPDVPGGVGTMHQVDMTEQTLHSVTETFESLDDLPPDERALYERMRD